MGNVLSKFRDSQRPKEKRPSNTLSAYLEQALQGYWDRQGRMANEGLQMADQGAKAVQAGNMGGLAGMLLGPAAYIGSPVSALFPERSEVEAATDVPEWSKPWLAGGLETMAIMAPGPKGKGLGRGLNELTDAATDAERAALAGRLEAEAAQTGGQASAVSRDQALRNLMEAQEAKPKKGLATQSYKETLPDGSTKWLPGTLRVNPPKQVFDPEMSPAYMRQLGLDPSKEYTQPKGMNSTAYKVTYEDGTMGWVPGLMRVKRPPK